MKRLAVDLAIATAFGLAVAAIVWLYVLRIGGAS